jgi:hypothetical protein
VAENPAKTPPHSGACALAKFKLSMRGGLSGPLEGRIIRRGRKFG